MVDAPGEHPDVLVILDGASEPVVGDEPTSLERAATPVLDALAQLGTLRRLRTTPDGLPAGSETGCALLLGWRPPAPVDRASLEAAARSIDVPAGQLARRVDVLNADRSRGDQALVGRVVAALDADGGDVRVARLGGHRLLLVGTPAAVEHATITAASHAPRVRRWEPGAAVPQRLDARTHVIGAPGAVLGLAALLGAATTAPDGYDGGADADLTPLADAALEVLDAAHPPVHLVVHVDAPDEAAHTLDPRAKTRAIEAADQQLLLPLVAWLHEHGGSLQVAVDHGCDPRTGDHDDAPTPALHWVSGDTDDDAPHSDTGLDSEDLPVMALPKRRASAAAHTGRRFTERWVAPLPIDEPTA